MKSVEQESKSLNEIADAANTTAGDARDAWRVVGICIAEGRDFPSYARKLVTA